MVHSGEVELRRLAAGLGACASVLLCCLLALASPAHATFPGQNGKIAFQKADGDEEIWTMNPDGTGAVKLTDNSAEDIDPAWSPDGRWLAFASSRDGNYELYVMRPDGSSQTRITTNTAVDTNPAWAPGAEKLAFQTNRDGNYEIYSMNIDGSDLTRLSNNPANDFEPSWAYDGSKIFFTSDRPGSYIIFYMNPDGSNQDSLGESGYSNYSPNGAPSFVGYAAIDTYTYETPEDDFVTEYYVYSIAYPTGTFRTYTACDTLGRPRGFYRRCDGAAGPAWSPDGTKVSHWEAPAYSIFVDDVANPTGSPQPLGPGTYHDWQPLQQGYARPKAATPTVVQLVPAYKACTNPNGSHGAPLAAPSCGPPVPESLFLTTGGSGQTPANLTGIVGFTAIPGVTATVLDEADVQLDVRLTDVRQATTLLDYAGELRAHVGVRATDKLNGPASNQSGSVTDFPLSFPVPCTVTSSDSIGSTCAVQTSVDAVVPGAAKEGRRSVWELGKVEVYDGGADGDADTTGDNTLFAVQGLFAP